jgi:hypothetical protein
MTFKQYMMIKETILRESVKLGIIGKDDASCLFKINRGLITFSYINIQIS